MYRACATIWEMANMLSLLSLRSHPPRPQRGRGGWVGGEVRAALTPGPSPAARERGGLGCRRGIIDRRRPRIAPAPLIPPSVPAVWARQGGWKEGEGHHPPPSSPAARERRGVGGEVRAAKRTPQHRRCNRCNLWRCLGRDSSTAQVFDHALTMTRLA